MIDVPSSANKVDVEVFDCGYYQLLVDDAEAAHGFHGEYIAEWAWGEEVVGDILFSEES